VACPSMRSWWPQPSALERVCVRAETPQRWQLRRRRKCTLTFGAAVSIASALVHAATPFSHFSSCTRPVHHTPSVHLSVRPSSRGSREVNRLWVVCRPPQHRLDERLCAERRNEAAVLWLIHRSMLTRCSTRCCSSQSHARVGKEVANNRRGRPRDTGRLDEVQLKLRERSQRSRRTLMYTAARLRWCDIMSSSRWVACSGVSLVAATGPMPITELAELRGACGAVPV